MNKKIVLVVIVVALLVLGMVLYQKGFFTKKHNTSPLTPVAVRLNWVPNAQFAGMYVAKEKGFYTDAGLDVTLLPYEDGLDQSLELDTGAVHFIIQSATELLTSLGAGSDFVSVGAIYQKSPYAFITLAEKKIDSPADFKGKILGSKGGNKEAAVTYRALLSSQNINLDEAVVKALDFGPTELEDLQSGRADVVDLYRTDQLYLFERSNIPHTLILPEQYNFGMYGDVLVTDSETIRDNPDLVRGFVGATFAGWKYALSHKDEAIEIILKYAADQYADEAYERYILEKSAPLITPTGGRSLGSMDFTSWKNAYAAVRQAGLIEKEFDAGSMYTNDFLDY